MPHKFTAVSYPLSTRISCSLDACQILGRDNSRVAEPVVRDRDGSHAGKLLGHEMGGDIARSHLYENCRSEFAHDFKGVVPADRMRDAGCEIQADGFGIREGATA